MAGIGCRKGVQAAVIVALVREAARGRSLDGLAVPAFRDDEPGVADAATLLGLPILWIAHAALKGEQGRCLTRSARAEAEVGLACVAEAAALAAVGAEGHLVAPRIAGGGATCAVAEGRAP